MNTEEIKISELKDKLKLSRGKALITSAISACFGFPSIVYYLTRIHPEWGNGLEEIIRQALSSKDFLIASLIFIIIYIMLFMICRFFTRYRISSKIIILQEQESDKRRSENEQLEKELDKCRSDNKYLEISSRLQSQKQSINTNIYISHTPDKPSAPKKSMYFKPTPVKHSGPETENYTGHTTPIDSDKIEILDIANDTANRHNEDQE
jgi:cell division protein FtsL